MAQPFTGADTERICAAPGCVAAVPVGRCGVNHETIAVGPAATMAGGTFCGADSEMVPFPGARPGAGTERSGRAATERTCQTPLAGDMVPQVGFRECGRGGR